MKNILIFSAMLVSISFLICGCGSSDIKNSDEASSVSPYGSNTTVTEQELKANNDMESLILKDLDILAEHGSDVDFDNLDNKHNQYFDEIVAFGKDALPFLELIADRSFDDYDNMELEHSVWALNAMYSIKPEMYDLSFPSPDEKYTAIITVKSFASFFNHGRSYKEIQIVENSTDQIIYTTELNNAYTLGGLFDIEMNWSKDSNFAVIDCIGRRSGSVMAININTKDYILLPGMEDAIEYVYPSKDVESLIESDDFVPRSWVNFEKWETDSIVKVTFNIGSFQYKAGTDFSGWYTYDLDKRKTIQMEYEFY